MPARRKCGPRRWSRPMPFATSTTSAPVASQTFAISLMNEMRVIRNAFAASLIISAELTSQRTISASSAVVERRDRVGVLGLERADDDAVGMHEVAHGVALGEELRVRRVADVLEAARVEAVAHLLAGADRHGRLHHEDRPRRRAAAAPRSPSRRARGRRRPSASAACRRRRRGTRSRPRRPRRA